MYLHYSDAFNFFVDSILKVISAYVPKKKKSTLKVPLWTAD